MPRLALLLCALLIVSCVSPAQTQPPAQTPAAELSEMPLDCLVAGEFTNPDQFCGIGERLMGILAEKPEPGMLRQVFGKMIGNPTMAGVALDRPMRFFYMSPKLHGLPWVYQVAVSDAEALKKALGQIRPAPPGPLAGALEFLQGEGGATVSKGLLLIRDGTATIYYSPGAGESLLRWQADHPAPPRWRAAGQLRGRVAIQHVLAAYGEEFAKEVQAMRERMREALEGPGKRPETEEGVRSAQGQLDTAVTLLKQVENIDVGVELSEAAAILRADALPLTDSSLLKLVKSHPRGSQELFRSCPAGADVVFAQNLSVMGAVSGLFLNRFGLSGVGQTIAATATAQTLFCLLLPENAKTGVSALLIRTNQTAETASQFWNRLAQGGEGAALTLRPVEAPAGEAAALAEVTFNEAKLGADGTRAMRRILGERPMAAQELRAGRSVLTVGAEPLSLLARVRTLEKDPAEGLSKDGAFSRTTALLPGAPNILLYASPAAVGRWLQLAEIPAAAPGMEAIGFAAACSLNTDGRVQAGCVVPLGQVLRARPALDAR